MNRLRIALSPLNELTGDTMVAFARLDRAGRVTESGHSALSALTRGRKSSGVECYLHPLDSVLTGIDLPPLSGSRLKAAVICAAQGLMLGNSDQMHIAHSARDAQGRVVVGWLPKAALARLTGLLSQIRLPLRGLYPAPFGLPVPVEGQVSAGLLDEHWLLRHSLDHAVVQPCHEDGLDERLVSGGEVCWIGTNAAADAQSLSAEQALSGVAPGWSLHAGLGHTGGQASSWTPALFCCVLAIAVWTSGLNLYAAREAAQGQALKAGMTQRVRQAFPELPVILNPLQQARQQLAARQGGAGSDPGQRFNHLMHQAAEGMPFLSGSVQSLTFSGDRLQLQMLEETPQVPVDSAWQDSLKQVGLSVSRQDRLWTLSPLAESTSAESDEARGDDHE
ncbi:type II secretion system protein GspL [Pseudomonas fragariae (ex Marin et al. 2024)]|uniref:type II secretion system protein GspL n=1 Tax=Pseudomonas fragariae (ex Marin et al. 2024) TaxID=3080056 RepID=UPI003F7ADCEF